MLYSKMKAILSSPFFLPCLFVSYIRWSHVWIWGRKPKTATIQTGHNCCTTFLWVCLLLLLAVFILEDALSVWTNLGKHLLLVWLVVSSIKTGTRRIIRLDKLFSVVRRSRRITEDNSSRRIMRLVPVFILETNNQTNNKCLPKFVQTDNASSSIKTAIVTFESADKI